MSLKISVSPQRRVAARFVLEARRALQKALAETPDANQSQIADLLDVNRSVISRQLNGRQDIGLSRVGEIAYALGFKPKLVLEKAPETAGRNKAPVIAPVAIVAGSSSSNQTVRKSGSPAISATQTVRRRTVALAEGV